MSDTLNLDPDREALRKSHKNMKRKQPPGGNGEEPELNYQILRNLKLIDYLETLEPETRRTWLTAQTYRPETITRFLEAIKAREILKSFSPEREKRGA